MRTLCIIDMPCDPNLVSSDFSSLNFNIRPSTAGLPKANLKWWS